MKLNHLGSLAFLFTISFPHFVAAEDMNVPKFSGGIKLGMFLVDSGASASFESATGYSVDMDNGVAFGLHGDYHIKDHWYVDFEYMTGSLDSKISSGASSASNDIDVTSFAVYGAYRSPEQLYYVGKLGLIYEDIGVGSYSDNEVGVSFAIGGGYKIQDNFSIEAEFTCVDQDIAFVGFTGRYQIK